MKNCFLTTIIVVLFSTYVFAQTETEIEVNDPAPSAFLGISSGINNMNGMFGVTGEVHLIDNIAIFGAAGLGGWGTKASIGIKYYRNFPYQTHFAISYSVAGGLNEFKQELDTKTPGGKQEVTMDLNKAKNINLIIGYNWKIFTRARFHLDFGYSIPLQDKAYEVTSNHVLSDDSEKVMNMMTPGGLIIGLGFSFSL